jgi:hypothetical protein
MSPPVIKILLAAKKNARIYWASVEAGNKCLTEVLQECK